MGTTHLSGLEVAGVPTMGIGGAPLFTGNWFFVDPVNGSDGNTGAADNPLATLYQAHAKAVAGNNDVVVLVGNGASSGTARLSLALAQTIDPTVTAGTLVWSKNATHLIGQTAPTAVAQRARIAPPTGVYTAATFGSANFVTVSGAGCYFGNFSLFDGFSTGGAAQICWTDTGGRNYYENVNFGGMADAASAQDTGSRSVKISGTGENTFVGCTLGLDTVTRTVANATLEFAGATVRNTFINCIFPFQGSSADVLGVIATGVGAIDRWQLFDRCKFINNIKSTSTAITGVAKLTSASSGGLLLFKDCTALGLAAYGYDATSKAQIYVDGAVPTAATTGIALVDS